MGNRQSQGSEGRGPPLSQFTYLNNSTYTPLTLDTPIPQQPIRQQSPSPPPPQPIETELQRKQQEQRQNSLIRERIVINQELELLRVLREREEELARARVEQERKRVEEERRLEEELRVRHQQQRVGMDGQRVGSQGVVLQNIQPVITIVKQQLSIDPLASSLPQNEIITIAVEPIPGTIGEISPQIAATPIVLQQVKPVEQDTFRSRVHNLGLTLLKSHDHLTTLKTTLKSSPLYHTYTQTSTSLSQHYLTPLCQLYKALPSALTDLKFQLIRDISFTQRCIGVGCASVLVGLGSFRVRPALYPMVRNMVVGYGVMGYFFVPEIYFWVVRDNTGNQGTN